MPLTKIVATLGPATEKEKTLISLIKTGVSVFRFNLKYNLPVWHQNLIEKARKAVSISKKPLALLFDLPRQNLKENFSFIFKNYFKDFSHSSLQQIDYLALSFVQKKEDIKEAKSQLKKLKLQTKILAKIESPLAIKNFDEILEESDGIMIARGDLGKKIPYEKVPYYQKEIIKKCIQKGKPVITATEMLKSMVQNPFPTRAEVSDVANAVLDYSDALMLSEETAIGKYPLKAVETMVKICDFWEKQRPEPNFDFEILHQTSALCYSAYQLWKSPFCQQKNVKAFLVLTRTGMTARALCRLRPTIPIFAFTGQKQIQNQLAISYGVLSFVYGEMKGFYKKLSSQEIKKILFKLKKLANFKKGEKIIFVFAEDWKNWGRANVLRIQNIP